MNVPSCFDLCFSLVCVTSTAKETLEEALLLNINKTKGELLLAEEATNEIIVSTSSRTIAKNDRFSDVDRVEHLVAVRNDANDGQRECLVDVVFREHVIVEHPFGVVSRDDEILFDGVPVLNGPLGLTFDRLSVSLCLLLCLDQKERERSRERPVDEADHLVRVTDGRELRVGADKGDVRVKHGLIGSGLDPGRRVANDVLEAVFLELVEDTFDAIVLERGLVLCLGCRKEKEILVSLVLDQGLAQGALLVDAVHKVVDDPSLHSLWDDRVSCQGTEKDDDEGRRKKKKRLTKWMSRFLRPTSKSITHVLCPCFARPIPMLAAVVVFPTPPFPDVTTTTLLSFLLV